MTRYCLRYFRLIVIAASLAALGVGCTNGSSSGISLDKSLYTISGMGLSTSVKITNNASTAVTVTSVSVTDPSDFETKDNCERSIAAKETCTETVVCLDDDEDTTLSVQSSKPTVYAGVKCL